MSQQGGTEIVKRDEEVGSAALARHVDDWDLGIPVERLVARVDKIREVQSKVMKEGQHFGVVPGTSGKPSLFKPGAEILTLTFQLDPQFAPVDRWNGEHLEVVVTCTLYSIVSGARVGSGVGSCSTMESKYAYRKGERKCPKCGKAAIIKGKEEFGGGWVCWKKKDGCDAKFKDGDASIEGQKSDRVANPDLPDLYNTVRKMACKRAHVAAVLFVTCASEIFTQDVEDMADKGHADDGGRDEAPQQQQRQQAPRGQQQRTSQQRRSQNGDRPDDNRGQRQQGSAPAEATESFLRLAQLIKDAKTIQELDDLIPELALARDEQSIEPDEYKLLREAYSTRSHELKGTRASA